MPIKSTTAKSTSKDFPKLMQAKDGVVVLFSAKDEGIVVVKGKGFNEVGHWSDMWNMDRFSDYNEPVTIQNI